MQRLNKVVEDILLGKYGIAWKNNGYYQVRVTRIIIGDLGRKVSSTMPCNKYITPFELLGVLEYEYYNITHNICTSMNCDVLCDFKGCVSSALIDAEVIVFDEIKRIQEGG